jgi:hypothetical protein
VEAKMGMNNINDRPGTWMILAAAAVIFVAMAALMVFFFLSS